jgi:hypothetical protein
VNPALCPRADAQTPVLLNALYCACTALVANTNVHGASHHLEMVIGYISTAYPFWNQSQGRDHVVWLTLDRGACYVDPKSHLEKAIKLVHFGYTFSNGTEKGPMGA